MMKMYGRTVVLVSTPAHPSHSYGTRAPFDPGSCPPALATIFFLLALWLITTSGYAQSTVVPYSFSTIAGMYYDGGGDWADGTNSQALFDHPESIAVDSSGNLYVADTYNEVIRKIVPMGSNIWNVTTIAGQPDVTGDADSATAATATFNAPRGVAVDGAGNVFVADTGNNLIREITVGGAVMTIAGDTSILFNGSPEGGYQDGAADQAQFDFPSSLAVDGSGNIYVVDSNNSLIRKLSKTGPANSWLVSTLAGSIASAGYGSADGMGTNAEFSYPNSLALDPAGNIYVADTENNEIRKVTPNGMVTTVAGSPPTFTAENNYYNGIPFPCNDSPQPTEAGFFLPYGIAVDTASNLYVADTYDCEIRKITPAGGVTTIGGQPIFEPYSYPIYPVGGNQNGAGSSALFSSPIGIAVDGNGNLYVGDTGNDEIRLGSAPVVQVVALEVNQAVQDWSNSVPLIQGKDTYVRAHLQLPSYDALPVSVSGALLYGYAADGSALAGSPISPINVGGALNVTTGNASNLVVRQNFNRSLNFRLPPEWLTGADTFQLDWSGGLKPVNVVSNNCSVAVTFVPGATPQVKFLDVLWTDTNGALHQLGDTIHDLRNRVLACFPVASLNVNYDALVIPGQSQPDFGVGEQFVRLVNSQLYTMRQRDAAHGLVTKRIYHGAIEDFYAGAEGNFDANIGGLASSPLPSVVSCASVVGIGYGPGRQSAAHELAHNVGLNHDVDKSIFGMTTIPNGLLGPEIVASGACNEKGPLDYVYPLFQTVDGAPAPGYKPALGPLYAGDNSLIFGLDAFSVNNSSDSPVLSPLELNIGDENCYYDLMSYCRNGGPEDLWPSSVTYTSLFNDINKFFGTTNASPGLARAQFLKSSGPRPRGGPEAGQDYLVVRGVVDMGAGTASFFPCLPITTTNPPAETPGTNFILEALDDIGNVIQSLSFTLAASVGEGADISQTADFNVSLTPDPSIRSLQLMFNGTPLATLPVSASTPTVTLTAPNGGQNFTSGVVNVTWSGSESGGNALTYTIEYSTDNGATWKTLAVDWPGQSVAVSGSLLDTTTQGLMRVIASDGFNTATAESAATFTVAPHAPVVNINAPLAGSLFIGDQQLFLDATVEDMQDGDLGGTNVQWSSDRDGSLGVGTVVNFDARNLSEGLHTITARAIDSAGLTNSAVTHVLVLHYPPPTLSLQIVPGQPGFYATYGMVSWPLYYTNYVLQGSPSLASGWNSLANPISQVGNQQAVNIGLTNQTSFYRLELHP